jgi:predicted phage-related endonuclease
MNKITITKTNATEDRLAWLALRRQHLTATDWPKITGTSRWGSAEDVVLDKLSEDSDGDFEPNIPMRVGTSLEPYIIERTKNRLGPGDYLSQVFISRQCLGFTPDLIRLDRGTEWVLSEIKVSVKDWRGVVPPDYLDQVRFQAMVLGLDEVQVVHLQLPSWQEGLRLVEVGAIPDRLLATYRVAVGVQERKLIERKAKRWWAENIEN